MLSIVGTQLGLIYPPTGSREKAAALCINWQLTALASVYYT